MMTTLDYELRAEDWLAYYLHHFDEAWAKAPAWWSFLRLKICHDRDRYSQQTADYLARWPYSSGARRVILEPQGLRVQFSAGERLLNWSHVQITRQDTIITFDIPTIDTVLVPRRIFVHSAQEDAFLQEVNRLQVSIGGPQTNDPNVSKANWWRQSGHTFSSPER